MQYSGTGALKTDFTRTGKRTTAGAAQDLMNSAIRYVRNNFLDSNKQDALDLLTGKYEFGPLRNTPPIDEFATFRMTVAGILTFSVLMIILNFILFLTSSSLSGNSTMSSLIFGGSFRVVLFWNVMVFGIIHVSLRLGQYLVRRPQLLDPYASPLTLNSGVYGTNLEWTARQNASLK